jgi:hypothetical protein
MGLYPQMAMPVSSGSGLTLITMVFFQLPKQ